MIVAVFRSRLLPEAQSEYKEWAERMNGIAVTMPGYISHKGFIAEDGERLTYVEFESEEALRTWSANPEHMRAKVKGRRHFFTEYQFKVCRVIREGNSQS